MTSWPTAGFFMGSSRGQPAKKNFFSGDPTYRLTIVNLKKIYYSLP
jgi:hypothetical protein